MRGRDEWCRDLLADEVFHFVDARAVADDKPLRFADQARDEKSFDRRAARYAGGERARSRISNVDRIRGERSDDARPGIKLAPFDLVAGRLLIGAVDDRDVRGIRLILVADPNGVRARLRLRCERGEGAGRK